MRVDIIKRPTGNIDDHLKHHTITDVNAIASYNWLDVSNPTILVPGSPPTWSPPTNPRSIPPDAGGFLYVDQNADRYPQCPIAPLFAAIRSLHPNYDFSSIDIITDRAPLRKLFAFAAGDPQLRDFRFGITVHGKGEKKTVVLHRMEKMTREKFAEDTLRGYRAGFEAQFLRRWNSMNDTTVKIAYYRIVEYRFGGLKFLVRGGVDGVFPLKEDSNNAGSKTDVGKTKNNNINTPKSMGRKPRFDGKSSHNKNKVALEPNPSKRTGKSKPTQSPTINDISTTTTNNSATTPDPPPLSIIHTPTTLPPQPTTLELTTRYKHGRYPFSLSSKLPDLYLLQTAFFIEAYHHSTGSRKFLPKPKTMGKFAVEDLK
ncbi:MAG: hypothetical protein Q9168_003229, partial [Polycauliona sp. 1 TL-2023]